jgi:hypothetical protein
LASDRARTRWPGYELFGLPWWAVKPFVTLAHFIMERKPLLGIAQRVEGNRTLVERRSEKRQTAA